MLATDDEVVDVVVETVRRWREPVDGPPRPERPVLARLALELLLVVVVVAVLTVGVVVGFGFRSRAVTPAGPRPAATVTHRT